nr:MAG: capsid protein [Cressdnaviricota sp.]
MIKINTNRKYATKNTKQYSRRVTRRIPRSVKSSTALSLRVESDETIFILNTTANPLFRNGGNPYMNFTDILTANPAFASQAINYSRYKITGCSVMAVPCFDSVGSNTSFGINGAPLIFIQQYPQLTSQTVGSECEYSDNNFMLKPYAGSQGKYWSYKSNYMIGIGSGVGTWNQTNSVGTQQGQLSVISQAGYTAVSAHISVFQIRVDLYVTFDGKSR